MPHTPSVSSSDTPSPPASNHSKSPQISPLPPGYLHPSLYNRQGNQANLAAPATAAGFPAAAVYPPSALPGTYISSLIKAFLSLTFR